ncbi:hypothetical protein C2E23DRAFT_729090 [Lenzites betulinus]|nr:hypothetical protein C2E23DRAFT_729090 [Lenzites betulinus]
MNSSSQYGDLATQLLTESRRSTATNSLLKYNDVLVRAIVREQRDLEARIEATLARSAAAPDGDDPAPAPAENAYMPTVLLYQTAILRNKRCLLAYHHHRLEFLKDLYWSVGGALPLLLSLPPAAANANAGPNANAQAAAAAATAAAMGAGAAPQDVRSKLSPHEVDFLRNYADSLLRLRVDAFSSAGGFAGAGGGAGDGVTEDIDLLAPIAHPPKDLQVHVRVVRDCGVVHTELGAIDFKRGHRFLVRRSDIEHLIVQGYLEES